MPKTYKFFLAPLCLTIFLCAYILLSAQKINTKETESELTKIDKNNFATEKALVVSSEVQEDRYIKNINKLSDEYQSFINNINKKSKLEHLDSESAYLIFGVNEKNAIEKINKTLEDTLVPSKYKDFHLLLSRSLLKLSSYVNNSNPKDMLLGVELFEEAKLAYDALI